MIVEAILKATEKADEAADEVTETGETFVELIGEDILEAAERVEEFVVELVRLYLKPRNESTNLLSNHLLRLYVKPPNSKMKPESILM